MNSNPENGDIRFSLKHFPSIQLSMAALTLLILTLALPASGQSLLWEAKSDTATVYLFGSVHYAKSDMYPLDAVVEDSFEKSSALVLELDPLNMDQVQVMQAIMEKGMYPDDKTIRDEISSEVFATLEEYIESTGLPMSAFIKMKPALLSITLSTLKMTQLGYAPEQGIDMYFALKASGKKPILELESVAEQMDLLFNLPDANLFLKYSIEDVSKSDDQIEGIIDAWRKGNAEMMNTLAIEEPLQQHPELGALMDEILFKRNRRMAEKIRGYLSDNKTYFLVVGAAHLVGDRGLVKLIEKAGYKVRKF